MTPHFLSSQQVFSFLAPECWPNAKCQNDGLSNLWLTEKVLRQHVLASRAVGEEWVSRRLDMTALHFLSVVLCLSCQRVHDVQLLYIYIYMRTSLYDLVYHAAVVHLQHCTLLLLDVVKLPAPL